MDALVTYLVAVLAVLVVVVLLLVVRARRRATAGRCSRTTR
ncbi:hypothetical protein [Micromonospora sp. NPDC005220]